MNALSKLSLCRLISFNLQSLAQSEVYGIVWLLDQTDLANLDRQELHYERIEVQVQKVGTDEFYKCWTYTQVSCLNEF